MVEKNEEYREVEGFADSYIKHGIEGVAAMYGIIEYAQYIEKIDYNQAKQLLYNFIGKMLVPEDFE